MKIVLLVAVLMMATFATAKGLSHKELLEAHPVPSIEQTVSKIFGSVSPDTFKNVVGGEAYNIARTGVGCAAGVFGGADTGFNIYDVVRSDPTDFEVYIFAVLYAIAWWQQNGQYLEYMCVNFWRLIQ